MKLWQLRTLPHGIERFQQFLNGGYVCIGWPGLGDLSNVSKDELREKIKSTYGTSGHSAGHTLGQINAFVNTMQSGDVVIISDKGWAYFAAAGDYEYNPQYDNDMDGACHRRPVNWLGKLPIHELNPSVQGFLKNRNTIAEYPDPIDESGLMHMFGNLPPIINQRLPQQSTAKLDSLFETALSILEEEMNSEDHDRRLKAATELIRLRKGG